MTAPDRLDDKVFRTLDARLERDAAHPVAIGLSGGGDSMALLDLAASWARTRGRRILALTVDHRLSPESKHWTVLARDAAMAAGAEWRGLVWEGDKPTTGLPAAARAARHGMIADAAREAGARVVLFAHTADDIAEADWMRERGSTLGRVREWSPSPIWPQGREVMLLRPLLAERREALREHLKRRGLGWIDDPANEDERFARSRARQSLNPPSSGKGLRFAERSDAPAERVRGYDAHRLNSNPSPFQAARCPSGRAEPIAGALGRSSSLPLGEGYIIGRSVDGAVLSAVLLCAAGTAVPPRADRLFRLFERLRSGENFSATLAGARVIARSDSVTVGCELGRTRCPETALSVGTPVVWDGRYEITAARSGYTVATAAGRLNRLSGADREIVKAVETPLRHTLPVLIRDDGSDPVLAWRLATVRALGPRRLTLALDQMTHERDLDRTIHGETPPPDLFSD